jgi:hypothetical protein
MQCRVCMHTLCATIQSRAAECVCMHIPKLLTQVLSLLSRSSTVHNVAVVSAPTDIALYTMRCNAGSGSSSSSSTLQGAADLGNIVNIHFRCPELAALLHVNNSSSSSSSSSSKSRAAMLYFVYSARGVCVMVAHNIEQGEWACQVPYFPPFESKEVSYCRHYVVYGTGTILIPLL